MARKNQRDRRSSNNNIQSNIGSPELTASKIVEILIEDFIAPLLCFGSSGCAARNSKTRSEDEVHHLNRKNPRFSHKMKSLVPMEESKSDHSSSSSTEVDSYYEGSLDTRDYDPKCLAREERIICEQSSISDELTDFQALWRKRTRMENNQDRDVLVPADIVVEGSSSYIINEQEELRKELRTIREQSSRLHCKKTNLRRLYESSKMSQHDQEAVNQRLKAKNHLLRQEGQELELELVEMKGHIETLRLEQRIMEGEVIQ